MYVAIKAEEKGSQKKVEGKEEGTNMCFQVPLWEVLTQLPELGLVYLVMSRGNGRKSGKKVLGILWKLDQVKDLF